MQTLQYDCSFDFFVLYIYFSAFVLVKLLSKNWRHEMTLLVNVANFWFLELSFLITESLQELQVKKKILWKSSTKFFLYYQKPLMWMKIGIYGFYPKLLAWLFAKVMLSIISSCNCFLLLFSMFVQYMKRIFLLVINVSR